METCINSEIGKLKGVIIPTPGSEVENRIAKAQLLPEICHHRGTPEMEEKLAEHSGSDLAPGKIIGYERNACTLEELNKNGFKIITAADVINGKDNLKDERQAIRDHHRRLRTDPWRRRCPVHDHARKKE